MPDPIGNKRGTEHRRHKRLTVKEKLRAVITAEDGTKTEAEVRDISAGGAALVVGINFYNETFVDLHMEGIGKVNARVARQFAEGVGVEFNLSEQERAKVKEELIKFRKAGGRRTY
jgi:hypothetical protein